jgi:heat-inducible transcriptional repressor
MPMEHHLSARKEAILRALVEEYVRTAEPVSSKQLSDQLAHVYGPGYASATVRNELAGLEEDGLIYQPHVSAGRVPTDLGYRYFVERLMGESHLSTEEQRLIHHQFYQVQHQLDEWVRLTASILSRALQSAAIITPPRAEEAHLKHFEVLSLHEAVVLLVLVLRDGTVRQERLVLDAPMGQDELSRLARRFNEHLYDATAERVAEFALGERGHVSPDEQMLLESLAQMLARLDILSPDAFYHEGVSQLLRREEFTHADPERIRQVVEALERNRFMPAIAPQVMAGDGVQVIIGSENETDALRDMSVVVARYGAKGQLSGLLGIVGPTRMQYGRAIAIVRYMTDLLNDLLAETYSSWDTTDAADSTGESAGGQRD